MTETYDRIGPGYGLVRREDPGIASLIRDALGDARSLVNVGAGAGSYEPRDLSVTAVEPSSEMIAQRPDGAAPVVQASAESLPFEDGSFDAAMAIQTVHHWPDAQAGLDEMIRVARKRVLVVAFDPDLLHDLWISADYFRGIIDLKDRPKADSKEFVRMLPGAGSRPIPVARECSDLFFAALWARPELFLEDDIVNPMWVWQSIPVGPRDAGRRRLAEELESGEWDRKYGHLRGQDELDVGLRLITLDK